MKEPMATSGYLATGPTEVQPPHIKTPISTETPGLRRSSGETLTQSSQELATESMIQESTPEMATTTSRLSTGTMAWKSTVDAATMRSGGEDQTMQKALTKSMAVLAMTSSGQLPMARIATEASPRVLLMV